MTTKDYSFVGKPEYLTPDIIAYATVHGYDYTDYNASDNYRKYIAESAFHMVSNIAITCPHQLRKTLEEARADKYTTAAAVSMLKEGFVFDETVSCYTNKHETKGVTYHKNITVSIKKD